MDKPKPISYASLLSRMTLGNNFSKQRTTDKAYHMDKSHKDDAFHQIDTKLISKNAQNRLGQKITETDETQSLFDVFNTDTIQRPIITRTIVEPVNKQQSTSFDTKSMAYYVDNLCKNIVDIVSKKNYAEFYEPDRELLKLFADKYTIVKSGWIALTHVLLKKMIELDKLYYSMNYFQTKETLIRNITNIILSYIVIGPDTKFGNGIDNLYGPATIIDNQNRLIFKRGLCVDKTYDAIYNKNSMAGPAINVMTNSYIDALLPMLKNIADNNNKIFAIGRQQNKLTDRRSRIATIIADLDATVKQHSTQVFKQKNIDAESKLAIEVKITACKSELVKLTAEQSDLQVKISQMIAQKKDLAKRCVDELDKLDACIKFNYFMHDTWCQSLDSVIPNRPDAPTNNYKV